MTGPHPRRPWLMLLVLGALAWTFALAPAAAQERPPDGLRDLWREYPLDESRTAPAPVPGSADSTSPRAAPARPSAEAEEDGALPVVVALVVLVLVLVGAFALRASRRRPQRKFQRRPGGAL